jgi:hypothetical protein
MVVMLDPCQLPAALKTTAAGSLELEQSVAQQRSTQVTQLPEATSQQAER